jgi:Ca2+-binding RTX toxin-like protein
VENAEVAVPTGMSVTGNDLDNSITGNEGSDVLAGGLGHDTLIGGAGTDALGGGAGNDRLDGGAGADQLSGGADADVFVFTSLPGAGDADTVSDFAGTDDRLAFVASAFAGLGAAGPLDPSRFASAATFASVDTEGTVDSLLKYETTTGRLYYDADANGAGAAVLVATLTGAPAVVAGDIDVL